MVFVCELCKNTFNDAFKFKRHLSRKTPCIIIPPIIEEKPLLHTITPLHIIKKDLASNECKYCSKILSSNIYRNKHELICKFKDDRIRILEIENGLPTTLQKSKTECKFYNKIFSRVDNLNTHLLICKVRIEYEAILDNQIIEKNKLINETKLLNQNIEKNKILNQNKLSIIDKPYKPSCYSLITVNYIYLIKEREFINSGEPIYKIGKSKQENAKRFSSYPKGSLLIYQKICSDCNTLELEIINEFRIKFINRKDIGSEYFEGNVEQMFDIMDVLVKKNGYNNCFFYPEII